MELNEKIDIKNSKISDLLDRLKEMEIALTDIEEKFVKGSGKGGQKKNTVSNRVVVTHVPTGIQASSQRDRQRSHNRFFALRILVEKLEAHFGIENARTIKYKKLAKQKQRRHARSQDKYEN